MTKPTDVIHFRDTIWQKGGELYREMPWRQDTRPYYVLVSELMLQQTQVDRVIPKFLSFIEAFPTVEQLAAASLSDVLVLWSGLGYNRRAKFLHSAARMIVDEYKGVFPQTVDELMQLPGVGKNTAGAIMVYAYNIPVVFIETNVRTVYFYHFFENSDQVSDAQLMDVVLSTIDQEHPREFYWALMDYGSWLKRQGIGGIRQSSHYKKQSVLKGSLREVRGMIVKQLVAGPQTKKDLRQAMPKDDRFLVALADLERENLITVQNDTVWLTK